ncbi:Hpt domain-containing protein, partial [Pseudomonadota bacterium]
MADQELLDAFATELAESEQEFAEALKVLADPVAGYSQVQDAKDDYCSYLRRVASSADMMGLSGIKDLASFLISNTEQLSKLGSQIRNNPTHLRLFEDWPKLLTSYIKDNKATQPVSALMMHIQDPHWLISIGDEKAFSIAEQLMGIEAEEHIPTEEQESQDFEIATRDSVEIAFDEDVDPQLIDIFLQESPLHVAKLSALFQSWSMNEINATEVVEAQRISHTIKGSANITGVKGIANLTHCMEDILETLAESEQLPPTDLCHTLIETTDCLEQMLEMLSGIGEPPADALSILQQLLDWQKQSQILSDLTSPVFIQEMTHGDLSPSSAEELTQNNMASPEFIQELTHSDLDLTDESTLDLTQRSLTSTELVEELTQIDLSSEEQTHESIQGDLSSSELTHVLTSSDLISPEFIQELTDESLSSPEPTQISTHSDQTSSEFNRESTPSDLTSPEFTQESGHSDLTSPDFTRDSTHSNLASPDFTRESDHSDLTSPDFTRESTYSDLTSPDEFTQESSSSDLNSPDFTRESSHSDLTSPDFTQESAHSELTS